MGFAVVCSHNETASSEVAKCSISLGSQRPYWAAVSPTECHSRCMHCCFMWGKEQVLVRLKLPTWDVDLINTASVCVATRYLQYPFNPSEHRDFWPTRGLMPLSDPSTKSCVTFVTNEKISICKSTITGWRLAKNSWNKAVFYWTNIL